VEAPQTRSRTVATPSLCHRDGVGLTRSECGRGHRTAARAERGAGEDRNRRWPRRARGAAGSWSSKGRPGSARLRCSRRRARRRPGAECACFARGRRRWRPISRSAWCGSCSSRRWSRHRSSSAPIYSKPLRASQPACSGCQAHLRQRLRPRRAWIRRSRSSTVSTGCAQPRRLGPALRGRRRCALG
jgi:hypothetical protein